MRDQRIHLLAARRDGPAAGDTCYIEKQTLQRQRGTPVAPLIFTIPLPLPVGLAMVVHKQACRGLDPAAGRSYA
jgi:hypothetical protein